MMATTGRDVGRRDTVPSDRRFGECLVSGDYIIRNVGTESSGMTFECFAGNRTEQLHRGIANRDLGSPYTFVIYVGANDLRRTGDLDYVTGNVYDLVNTAKLSFQHPE
jgi:hypothetical protein